MLGRRRTKRRDGLNEDDPDLSNEGSQREAQIDRYLDGLMSPEERAAFGALLARDAMLRAEEALQGEIDASLKRRFGPVPRVAAPGAGAADRGAAEGPVRLTGAAKGARARGGAGAGAKRRWRGAVWGVLGMAAAIAVAAVAVWRLGGLGQAGPAQALYAAKEKDGFAYKWACESDADFIEYTTAMFGQPLVGRSSATARLVGWDYVPETWSPTIGLLVAKVEGADVLLVIEPAGCGGGREPTGGDGLNVFSRAIGPVMVYEITPLDHAGAMELLAAADGN